MPTSIKYPEAKFVCSHEHCHINIQMHARTQSYKYSDALTNILIQMHTRTHSYKYTDVHMNTLIQIYRCTHAHLHTHI